MATTPPTEVRDAATLEGLNRDVELVGSADEVYGLSMERTPDGYRLRLHLHGAEVSASRGR